MGRQRKQTQPAGSGLLTALLEHSAAGCLFLALFILTLLGVGNALAVGALGLALCVLGLGQEEARVDLGVFVPLVLYNLMSAISSFRTYGNLIDGFASTQVIFPLLYLLVACLEEKERLFLRRLCATWVGTAAVYGIGQFAWLAVTSGTRRLSGLMGNPNAMGIFLVVGWFALVGCIPRSGERPGWAVCLRYLEPAVLIALSLTLSMGSFLSLAVGMAVLVRNETRHGSWRDVFRLTCRLLAKASLCMGLGVLAYLAASRTDVAWSCIPVLVYGGVIAAHWPRLEHFLEARPRMAAVLAAGGTLVAGAAVLVRPSSIATFAERLKMMKNGLGYLFREPLLGVGPYQWRLLNLYDGDTYFNTYHIHNVFLHVGVELGLVAAAMLAVVAVRHWQKKKPAAQRGGFAAFFFHSMMDTGFFYLGITGLTLLTVSDPWQRGKLLREKTLRGMFGAFALLFAYNIYCVLIGG